MLTPSLVSVTFRQLSPAEIIALVKLANLRAIEWGGDVHVPSTDRQRATDVRRQTEDAGLIVSAYGSYYRVGQREPFEPVLETAAALGAPTIRVWAGNVGSAQADGKCRALVVSESQRIAGLAAARNISISYEFHDGTLTDTNESAIQLLAEVDHPNVFTFWQPPNGRDIEYCLSGLRALLPRLTCVHVFHWWPDHNHRHPLAAGADRWARYLEVLRSCTRDYFVALEFVCDDEPAMFLEDGATLRQWLGG